MLHKWFEKARVGEEIKIIEFRKEDIWKRRCRIIDRKGLEYTGREDFSELMEKPCIFCTPDRVSKFGKEFGVEMLSNEEAFLFPNISPYAKYSAVCAFRKHYIGMDEFSPTLVMKNLMLGVEYIKRVEEMDDVGFASISWNYMMPAGASMLHPHTQIIVDVHPTFYMEKLLEREREFEEYIDMEKKSERYIGNVENIELFTPFVPFGYNEIMGVSEEGMKVKNMATALSKIISYYSSIGRNTFNISIYMGLKNQFPLHFRCITRQNMGKFYRNDTAFLERLHNEVVLERKPEEVAEDVRKYLRNME